MLVCTAPASLAASSSSSGASPTRFASCSLSASASFPFPGPLPCASPRRELYLRTLEQEREEILAAAYAAKTRPSSPSSPPEQRTHPALDPDFRESVRRRQARLEFLRRQDFARRLAHRGLQDAAASAYAIKRLPPPRARPAERLRAARTIQRAFRAHLAAARAALASLAALPARVHAARAAFLADLAACRACSDMDTSAAIARALQTLLRDGVPGCAHPRVRAAASAAEVALRGELARLARARLVHGALMLQGSGGPFPFWESESESESSDDEEEEEEEDGDCAWSDSDSECSLETVEDAPQHAQHSRLFVVREEDEDDDDDEGCRAAALSALFLQSQSHQKQRGTRRLPAPSYRPRSHSPVARSPALDSIPEDDAEGGGV